MTDTGNATTSVSGKAPEANKPADDAKSDKFANGLYEQLAPAVQQCDEHIRSVLVSQETLGSHIERLNGALNSFTDTVKSPPALAPYSTKLANSRKRLKKIKATVAKINERLDEIRTMVRKKEASMPKKAAQTLPSSPSGSLAGVGNALAQPAAVPAPSNANAAPSLAKPEAKEQKTDGKGADAGKPVASQSTVLDLLDW